LTIRLPEVVFSPPVQFEFDMVKVSKEVRTDNNKVRFREKICKQRPLTPPKRNKTFLNLGNSLRSSTRKTIENWCLSREKTVSKLHDSKRCEVERTVLKTKKFVDICKFESKTHINWMEISIHARTQTTTTTTTTTTNQMWVITSCCEFKNWSFNSWVVFWHSLVATLHIVRTCVDRVLWYSLLEDPFDMFQEFLFWSEEKKNDKTEIH
jgi:hypothetical protein